jgi:hypothetical protein
MKSARDRALLAIQNGMLSQYSTAAIDMLSRDDSEGGRQLQKLVAAIEEQLAAAHREAQKAAAPS